VGKLVTFRSPRQSAAEGTAGVGMIIFLGSWAMMFAALFFAYGGLRLRAEGWPPPGTPTLPVLLPAINTVVIGLSSLTFNNALSSARAGLASRIGPAIAATFALGLCFLGLQSWVWSALYARGLEPSSGAYGAVFYGLTWIHALHVGVGLLALAWLGARAFRGAYGATRYLTIKLWAMYWHFVGVVWLLMFVSVYLI
jgi:cytochrome c oxidase subunit 3